MPEGWGACPELRSGEAQNEDRLLSRPLEQMPDELDERRVGPLQVLEQERDRPLIGHALEEEAPGAEQLLLAPDRAVLEPEQVQQARLDESVFLVVETELLAWRPGPSAAADARSSPS